VDTSRDNRDILCLKRQNILVALQSGLIDIETAELLLDGLQSSQRNSDAETRSSDEEAAILEADVEPRPSSSQHPKASG
jgi:hypothetical protein